MVVNVKGDYAFEDQRPMGDFDQNWVVNLNGKAERKK